MKLQYNNTVILLLCMACSWSEQPVQSGLLSARSTAVVSKTLTTPYGTLLRSTPTRYTFTGQEHDTALQSQDYNARFYSHSLGRFLAIDPVFHAGESPYAYVQNNPLIYTDPDGMDQKARLQALNQKLFQTHATAYALEQQQIRQTQGPEWLRTLKSFGAYVNDSLTQVRHFFNPPEELRKTDEYKSFYNSSIQYALGKTSEERHEFADESALFMAGFIQNGGGMGTLENVSIATVQKLAKEAPVLIKALEQARTATTKNFFSSSGRRAGDATEKLIKHLIANGLPKAEVEALQEGLNQVGELVFKLQHSLLEGKWHLPNSERIANFNRKALAEYSKVLWDQVQNFCKDYLALLPPSTW